MRRRLDELDAPQALDPVEVTDGALDIEIVGRIEVPGICALEVERAD